MSVTFELTHDLLMPVIKKLLNDDSARPLNFTVKPLKPGVGNPTSLGVYRVIAQVEASSGQQEVSLVVKHLADGKPMMDTSEPTHWNYWRREIEFFESPLALRIPASIGFPEYLGQSNLDDGTALFWNGDLGDLTKSQWTWEHCLSAAKLVAELNSIDSIDLAEFDWLNRTQPEGWLEFGEPIFDKTLAAVSTLAKSDPQTAKAFENYGPFLADREFINALIHGQRQCFVHGDFNLNNLVPTKSGSIDLIALDWQLCGVGPVGGEIASILNTAIELGVTASFENEFEEICRAYFERFNAFNPENPTNLNEVRLAAAATGFFIIAGVGFFLSQPDPNKSDEENQQTLQNLVDNFSTGLLMKYASVLHELT